MTTKPPPPAEPLQWQFVKVDGRTTKYAAAGSGEPVVFLHGWALSDRPYRAGLERLVASGAAVYAPALPGFGGTPLLPPESLSLEGYAHWVADFVGAIGIDPPVTLIGHSFGGGVALQTAHDHPDLVSRLILVNSIGGSIWKSGRDMRQRPLWDWGIHLSNEAVAGQLLARVLPVVLHDAALNAVRNPRALWHVGKLARDADLREHLSTVRGRRLPVFVLWGQEDRVIPLASAEALVGGAPGVPLLTVPGDHNWLITDPGLFAEVITNVVGAAPNGADDRVPAAS